MNSRSKLGCRTCRGRKVKCDEAKPACLMCTRLRLRCEYAAEHPACLHDRRVGAGSIKKRQYTNWRPQRIEPKAVASPPVGNVNSFPTPASDYNDFRPQEPARPPNNSGSSSNMAPYGPIPADTAADHGLDFSSFLHDDLLAQDTTLRTPSPFDYLPALLDDAEFMSFGSLPAPPSPLLSAAVALGASPGASASASTPTTADEEDAMTRACYPSPLAGLVLGTSTVVLASFASRARLTGRDYEALLLFHQQVGFSIGSKSPTWSTHAILVKLAVHHAAILHFLLAASFGEQHWRLTAAAAAAAPGGGEGRESSSTPAGERARRHYEAGEAALQELAAARHGRNADADAALYHVVVVACFWLEYLIHRRRTESTTATPQQQQQRQPHRRWSSNAAFSRAMGDYVQTHKLRRTLVGGGTQAPSSTARSKALSSLEYGRADDDDDDDDDDPSSDEEDEGQEDDQSGIDNESTVLQTATTHVTTAARSPPPPPPKYHAFLSRLLSWLYWSDCAACFFGKGGGLAARLVCRRRRPRGQLGLYEAARTTLLDFWDDYTPEEIADDNQNWPALQLVNETWVGVHRLNLLHEAAAEQAATEQKTRQFRVSSSSSSSSSPPPETLADVVRDARALRARYATVFRLSAFETAATTTTTTTGGHRSRLLATADWAVCHHLALELHLLRAGAAREDLFGGEDVEDGGDDKNENKNDEARLAAQIVHLAERALRLVGAVELDRFQWPLFWAGVATDDHVYRYFVLAHLINADFRAALQAVAAAREAPKDSSGSSMSIARLRAVCRAAGTAI